MTAARAQSSLLSVTVAVVLLVSAAGLAVAVADDALVRADRDPVARHAAAATADALVSTGPVVRNPNVVGGARAANLTAAAVDDAAPSARGRPVAVRLGGRTLVERGSPTGPTVRRAVRVARTVRVTETYAPTATRVVVPPGVDRVSVSVRPAPNATPRALRADGRVVLYNTGGIGGVSTVRISPRDRTVIRPPAANATVRVAYTRLRTNTTTLEVQSGAG